MGIKNMEERRVIVNGVSFDQVENIRTGKTNERNKMAEGISGEIAQIKRASNLGFIEIDILATSASNQIIQAIYDLDQNCAVLIQDDSGTDLFLMSSAAPEKDPDWESSDDEGAIITWRFIGKFNTYNIGGNS